MGGPTLDVITELKCPDGTFHKCLPYGDCYDYQSYCSDKSRSVNSCFPDNIVGNNESLLAWCREQTTNNINTQRPHPACKLACLDKFGIAALYPRPPCQNENSADYTWAIYVIAILAILLICSLIGNIVFWVRQRKTPRQQNATPDQIPRPNSKNSVNDETEGPAAPPARGAIETDQNRNQPALSDRNVPLHIQLDHVQDRSATNTQPNQFDPAQDGSTNTQSGAPTTLTPIDQSTINIQSEQARYYTPPRASVASARPRRDYDDTSAESLALIPRNQATESGDDISPTQTPTDLSIHTSTTIPEANGRHLVVTNFATYE